MGTDDGDRGRRWRAGLRAALGKPGSLQRWLVGSLIFLVPVALLLVFSGFVARIVIFIFAALLVVGAFRARALLVGDEDEFRAALRRDASLRSAASEPDDVPLEGPELDALMLLRAQGGEAPPPPPVAEVEEPALPSDGAQPGGPTEQAPQPDAPKSGAQ